MGAPVGVNSLWWSTQSSGSLWGEVGLVFSFFVLPQVGVKSPYSWVVSLVGIR